MINIRNTQDNTKCLKSQIWKFGELSSLKLYPIIQGRTSDKAEIPTGQLTVETKLTIGTLKRLLEGLKNCVFWLICGIPERNTKNEVLFS